MKSNAEIWLNLDLVWWNETEMAAMVEWPATATKQKQANQPANSTNPQLIDWLTELIEDLQSNQKSTSIIAGLRECWLLELACFQYYNSNLYEVEWYNIIIFLVLLYSSVGLKSAIHSAQSNFNFNFIQQIST